jgi:HlyD family secretion protein
MGLDDREQLAAIAVAEAEWEVARSERERVLAGINPHQIEASARKVEVLDEQVRYLQREHARARSLLGRNTMSPAEYDRAFTEWSLRRTELRQAEADLQHLRHHVRDEDRALAEASVVAAEAKLHLARQRHEDTILRAPFDGVVLELLKREGEGSRLFDPEPVAIFGDLSRLRVRAEIDERFVAGLGAGQRASVFGRGLGDREYPGRIVLVKSIMGKKTVFSRSAAERKDLDVIQVMVEMGDGFTAPIGLEVDVEIFVRD